MLKPSFLSMRLAIVAIVVSCIAIVGILPANAQSPRDDTIAIISSPTEENVVSGQVQIIGSAGHPSLFAGYELEFDNLIDATEIWIPIGQRINQQITNGVLGIWDTVETRVADGNYRIRLRVFLNGEAEPIEFVVNNVQVINTAPTALPTIRPDDPTPTQQLPATEGPSPTPLISQPPTATPRPTLVALAENPSSDGTNQSGDSDFSVNFNSLQSSFCTGVYIAFLGFAILGVYLWIRARVRPTARQMWWQIKNEFDRDN